jgi:multicomponent Na+:H+ antiporter subunit D
MIADLLSPAPVLILGALLVPFLNGKAKSVYMLLLPAAVWLLVLSLPEGKACTGELWGYTLVLCRVDKLSMVFGTIFCLMTFLGVLFALQVKDDLQHVAALVYAGSTLGVVYAGDVLTLYIYWEFMAVSSTFLILASRTREAREAGFRYILVHLIGGLFLLAGIVLYVQTRGTLEFDYIGLDGIGSWLMFIGIALNAAAIPLHAWLPDAYPMGTPTSTVFLSAFTTKSAVYLMARTFPGAAPLVWIGAVMVFVPIFYAVLENDIRRVLAYSLLNQVGFMLCGIGIGTALALNGAVSHAFCHILYKALLFMAAGSVLHMTGKIKCTEIGGLYKTMPLTCLFCMVGAASISAFPLFSGFVSKSMVVSASAHEKMAVVWLILQFASAGVFHHAGIKVPFFTFFGHDSGIRTKEPPWNMLLAMGLAAFLCVGIGIYPDPLYRILPFPVEYVPYTGAHVVGQLQLLMFGALAFALLILSGYYPPEIRSVNLDADWFYRMFGRGSFRVLDWGLNALNARAEHWVRVWARGLSVVFQNMTSGLLLFFAVNGWALLGYRGKRLEMKKYRLYADVQNGSLPIGFGAAVATVFIVVIFVCT